MKKKKNYNEENFNIKIKNKLIETSSQTNLSPRLYIKSNSKYRIISLEKKKSKIDNKKLKTIEVPIFEKKKFPVSVSLKTLFINKEDKINNNNNNNIYESNYSYKKTNQYNYLERLKQNEKIQKKLKKFYELINLDKRMILKTDLNNNLSGRNNNNYFNNDIIHNYNLKSQRFYNNEINNRKDFDIITENSSFNFFKNKLLKEKVIAKKNYFKKFYITHKTFDSRIGGSNFMDKSERNILNIENIHNNFFSENKY